MEIKKMSVGHHRIVPIALICLGLPIAIVVGFLLIANILFHDEKPPDDSAMQLSDVVLSADENAYTEVVNMNSDFTAAAPNLVQPFTDEKVDNMLNGGEWDEAYAVEQTTKFAQARIDFGKAASFERYQGPEGAHPNNVNPNSFSQATYNLRYVAKFVALEALRKARQGDVSGGLDEAFNIVRLAQTIEQSQPTLIEWLVGSATKQIGLSALRQIAHQSELTVDQAKATAQTLETYRGSTENVVKTIKVEYAHYRSNWFLYQHLGVLYDQFYLNGDHPNRRSATGQFISLLDAAGITRFYFWPNQNQRFALENHTQLMDIVQTECTLVTNTIQYPAVRSMRTGFGRLIESNSIGKFIADIGRVSYGGITEKRCNESLAVAATQIALAASAYIKETKGLPSQLDDLVPKYLASVPLDPYNAQPLHYNNSTGVIYSVGPKRVDSGGSPVSADWQTQDNPSFSIH